jgi:hypothetical protein
MSTTATKQSTKKSISKVHRQTSGNRAGLNLPVCRMASILRKSVPSKMHVSSKFTIALTAAIEYMDRELIELMTEQKGKTSILTSKKLNEVISKDAELRDIFRSYIIVKPKKAIAAVPKPKETTAATVNKK